MTGFSFKEVKSSPPSPAPAPTPAKTESSRKESTRTLLNQKENSKGDAYLKDCVICRNDAKVTISQSTPHVPQKQNETTRPKTEQTAKQDPKENTSTEKVNQNNLKSEIQSGETIHKTLEKILVRETIKENRNNVSSTNIAPPQKIKTEPQNKTLVFSEKVSIENPSNHSVVSNNVSENKTVSPVTVTTTQNTNPESKTGLQNIPASFQKASIASGPTQISSTAPALLVNPAPQINIIPQVVPTLNTVLLTQLIPQRLIPNGKEIKSFGDFLPVKNVKQNLIDPEKFQFSTPLISTKVLAQILANKDTTSLNTLRAILHLFGREIEDEKDDTDLEGSYGIWKEYLKKIKRKKAKQALNKKSSKKISLPHRMAIEEA